MQTEAQSMQMMGASPMNLIELPSLLTNNPSFFHFTGNSLSLLSRLNSMTEQQASRILDATILVTGREFQDMNTCGCVMAGIFGGLVILPLFFMCCNWWNSCVHAAYEVDPAIYSSLSKLFKSPNLKSMTLIVMDNTFGQNKARILHQMISQSRINGFTFVNKAGEWNFVNSEYSDFIDNMKAIKMLPNVISDIRWGSKICL